MKQIQKVISLLLISALPVLQGCVVVAAGGAAIGASLAVDRRTAGTMLDDQSTEIKAMHAISQDHPLWRASHINFVSYNNVLLMVGQTPTEAYKRQAEALISDIPKIRRIHNELTVEKPISLTARSRDTWVTAQIKTQLVGHKGIRANRIKVITENDVVYLMGLVTPQEENIATDIARAIPGVEKVVQIFEFAE